MLLVVLAFVASFQTLGTLMAVGLLMLPATAARFWTKDIVALCLVAALLAAISGVAGLLISFHVHIPSGPAIVLVAGALYMLSLLIGARESVWVSLRRNTRHKLS
jgi:zinc/manganese transport system permease protein